VIRDVDAFEQRQNRRAWVVLASAGLALIGLLLTPAPLAVKLGFPSFMVALALFARWSTRRIAADLRQRQAADPN
jgi:hypothetical protein